ncbi:NUT family member 1 [Ctenodactylus gundi]
MASDGASPLPGLDPGAALSPFTAFPFPPPIPDTPDQPPWEPSSQPASAFSPGNPLMLSTLPSPLMVTADGGSGPSGVGPLKVIVKVKTEAGPAEPSQAQNFILTQKALNRTASSTPCGACEGPPPQYVTASSVNALRPTSAVAVSQGPPSGLLPQALPPAAHLAPIVPSEKAWPGPQVAAREGGPVAIRQPSSGQLVSTSKGIYENFRRWQRYKPLAWRHLPQSPDAEALSCFLIPVLRSLARLKPTMTLEEGLPRAVQEWNHTSNYDRMIYYEMAEKFIEFEAEEKLQIQHTKLMNGSQGLSPVAPSKWSPSGAVAPEACQQPAYIPKKAASKTRAPRRRQRKPQRPAAPQAPKEIPPEAVEEYINIVEELVESQLFIGESGGQQEAEEEQQEDEEMCLDPGLLSYMETLCSQKAFVSKVEAVIHPQFLADLLSPEQHRDPLSLSEELEQEDRLTFDQLIQKRLLALGEEDVEALPGGSGVQLHLSPSVSDEDEDGGGQPSPGPWGVGGTVHLRKASSEKQARQTHGEQVHALDGPRGTCSIGNALGRLTQRQDSSLEQVRSPGHSSASDRIPEALPPCQQGSPQPKRAPELDVSLAEPAFPQGQGLKGPALGWQTGQGTGGLKVLPQGKDPSTVAQRGFSGAIWGDDSGPFRVQSYDENPTPRVVWDRDRASLSPGLWLSSEINAIGLKLPSQIEEDIDSLRDGECTAECQAVGSASNISPSPGDTTELADERSSVVPYVSTYYQAAVGKGNDGSLSESLRVNSPALGPKGDGEQSSETIENPSDLWAEACSPLLESEVGAPDTLLAICQDDLLLRPQDDSSFPETSLEAGNTGHPFSPLLETSDIINILVISDDCGLQVGVSQDTCPPNLNSYDPQEQGREDSGLSKSNNLVPLQGNQESHTPEILKSPSPRQGPEHASPSQRTKDPLGQRETSSQSKTYNSAEGALEREKEELQQEEDEQFSNFTCLLASKLSLSPSKLPFRPCHASGDRDIQTPYPVVKSGKRILDGTPGPAKKRPQAGAQAGLSKEMSEVLGVVQSQKPLKRQRDSSVTGKRKKKRRRNQ